MKNLLFSAMALLVFGLAQGQQLPDFDSYNLEEAASFNPQTDKAALQAATYLLSTPVTADKDQRQKALVFLITWMTNTPDYSFSIYPTITKVTDGNSEILGLYMAAMAEYALEHPGSLEDGDTVQLEALKMLIDYAENRKNGLKMTSGLKQAAKADKKGNLLEFLLD